MQPSPMKTTEETGWSDLPAVLDLAVFEQLPDARFRPVGRLPDWLPLPANRPGETIDLTEHFPLLELFFAECEPAWESTAGLRMDSDIWSEQGAHGRELYLQAVATSAGGRRLIILRSLPEALFTYQQLAHDLELEKERVERMSRELIAVNRELERATRAKSDFLATMSHEIRTPLNAIIGMADVLSGTTLTSEQQKCVDVFQRNGVSLLNLINDILDLSKVESGKVELEVMPFDLADVIARAMEVVEVRSTAKGLTLRQTIGPGVPVFLAGDPNRLRQIVINLLGNSIKFTEHGGLEVQVESDPEDARPGSLRFAISDTGIGIPADKIDQIFESFTQVDSSTTRKYGGTGLGLTISRQLVELMGGRIWVESMVGKGSTFFFTAKFGLQENQSQRPEPRATTPGVASTSVRPGLRILLADDSEDNRFLILSYLNHAQASIDVAENGAIAARMFRSGRYDLVLMDVEMPVMDGYAATQEIRRFERQTGASPTPVLALTAHAFADMAEKSLAAGFTGHLTKPIRKVTLLEAVGSADDREASSAFVDAHFKIPIEPGMEDVVPGYLDKRRKEIPQYQQALANQDFDTIRMLGHKMKGTGAGYGFEELTSLGGALEQAALRKDIPEIQTKLDEFARYVEAVELEYPES
ncbi:MAG: ATP-binding protein [Bryobacteraceae bacterium]